MNRHPGGTDDVEQRLRAYRAQALAYRAAGQEDEARREWEQATALIIRVYGAELNRWISHKVVDPAAARDVFQEFCTWLWRGLPGFRWNASLRSWLYKMAFHVLCHQARAPQRRPPEEETSLESIDISVIGVEMSTMGTRMGKRQVLIECLEQLSVTDRHLILLRQVEEETASWKELARIWNGYVPMSEAALEGEAARLRQRFHRALEALKRAARDRGLEI
jgi:RNA polymerase sigma-70 factor, ECF subfamily